MTSASLRAESRGFVPAERVRGLSPYAPPGKSPLVDLALDSNEGPEPSGSLMRVLSNLREDQFRRYPSASELEVALGDRFGISADEVVVTNGADDAIDRVCRVALEPGREALIHTPTFEMIERSVRLAGGAARSVDWLDGAFPVRGMIDAMTGATSLVAVVSPNNPTGGVVGIDDMLGLARAAGKVGAIVMFDLAYVEFADDDPTSALLEEPNVVVVRTFSKAMGLAGARVGYALTSPEVAGWVRGVGGPYPVGSPSLALAGASLAGTPGRRAYVEAVRQEREDLSDLLSTLGCRVLESQANFLTARFDDASFVRRALMSLGISVRAFPDRAELDGCVRITLPGVASDFDRLRRALRTILDPEAVLFDLDGVLADVSGSYRAAILETARTYGVELTPDDVGDAKRAGDANNDWELTQRLIERRGVACELDEVVARFQRVYEGSAAEPGLRETERLIGDPAVLRRLGERRPLGIVTGRPRSEAEWFLDRAGIRGLFSTIIAMEDAPAKPSAEPVIRAMNELGVSRVWMVGDTPDDAVAARGAGAVPIGIVAPGDEDRSACEALLESGAASVIDTLGELEGMIR